MVRRKQPCCPHRCRQARDRRREGGTTDLSFIPDCSMAEAHESVKPKSVSTVSDISDIQACEKLSDQLHPEAFSPGASQQYGLWTRDGAHVAHQVLPAHGQAGRVLGPCPHPMPHSLSYLHLLPSAAGPHCHLTFLTPTQSQMVPLTRQAQTEPPLGGCPS